MGEAGHDAPAAVKEGFPAWARSVEECEKRFGTDRERGLTSGEAAARLRAHGPNELLEHPGPSVLQLVAQQFEDTLVRIPLARSNTASSPPYSPCSSPSPSLAPISSSPPPPSCPQPPSLMHSAATTTASLAGHPRWGSLEDPRPRI